MQGRQRREAFDRLLYCAIDQAGRCKACAAMHYAVCNDTRCAPAQKIAQYRVWLLVQGMVAVRDSLRRFAACLKQAQAYR